MDNEEYNELYNELKRYKLDSRIETLLTNYQVKPEDFVVKYEAVKYMLTDLKGLAPAEFNRAIIERMEQDLVEATKVSQKKMQGGAAKTTTAQKMAPKKSVGATALAKQFSNMDIFSSIKVCADSKKKEKEQRESTSPAASKAGQMQANKRLSAAAPVVNGYHQRKNRGAVKCTYNEGVTRTTGAQNPSGSFFVNTDELSNYTFKGTPTQPYSFFNSTADARTEAMQAQFELVEKMLLQQMFREAFDEFYSPTQERQFVCGRVVNLSTEEPKLKESTVGLFNAAYDASQCRLRLNLAEVPNVTLFEGEIVVAEGFMDSKKFNVNRIHKPKVAQAGEQALFTPQQMQFCQNNYAGRALQLMFACGPFTVNNELSFDALKDLMPVIEREQPHALVLAGPFISQNNEQVQSGDIRYMDPVTNEEVFIDYDELFTRIMDYIFESLSPSLQQKLEIILVPSHQEITHIFPVPQPAMPTEMFANCKFRRFGKMPHLVGNPSMFTLNDISVGIMNADLMFDMCKNLVNKFTLSEAGKNAKMGNMGIGGLPTANLVEEKAPTKIDTVFKSILEQHNFYPLYPAGEMPLEVQQYESMMFKATPDIMITPSDLKPCAENIYGTICVNPGALLKKNGGGSYGVFTIDAMSSANLQRQMAEKSGQRMCNRASDRIRVDIYNI